MTKKQSKLWLLAGSAAMLAVLACAGCGEQEESPLSAASASPGIEAADSAVNASIDEQPSAVYYQIFVRSFYDSNGDGIGDLKGIEEKLDYLQGLGIEGLWLTPLNPSPSYHGYDVTDYYDVNPQFGTLDDYRHLLEAAHKRGMKIIMDLVVNHTSTKHPWFVDSASGRDSSHRNWYTWQDGIDADQSAQLSATGGAAWHKKGSDAYLGVFWEGMPDLNFDNPAVRQEMVRVGQFWLKQGVDGFRLDAAKHIYEDFKTSSGDKEVAQKNQTWWREFRQGLQEIKPDAYLVGEVWDSTSVAAPYLNRAFDSTLNFDLNKVLRSSADTERSANIAGMLGRSYQVFSQESGGAFVDAPFLGSHDMDRLMSAFNGNKDHAKMAAALLLTLPGNPFIYYGDEIGMQGRGADEHKREPMLWYEAGAGKGQATWEPAVSNRGLQESSVEAQMADPDSLYSHYKKLIELRKSEPALRDGDIRSYDAGNSSVSAYMRLTNREKALVVHNLSGKEQSVPIRQDGSGLSGRIVFSSKERAKLEGGQLSLPPYSTVVIK